MSDEEEEVDFGTHPGLPWPAMEALRAVVDDYKVEAPTFHEVALSAIARHEPVPDHGRFSEDGCSAPDDHGQFHVGSPPRAPVCKTCRDFAGDPHIAPCEDLVDWGRVFGVDFT